MTLYPKHRATKNGQNFQFWKHQLLSQKLTLEYTSFTNFHVYFYKSKALQKLLYSPIIDLENIVFF